MKWTDTYAIAEALYDKFPDVDPAGVRFTDLRRWVLDNDGCAYDPPRSGVR
ncbi:MAG: Fe-S cluster assembly protein IscX, partial [Cupriavidus sp.]|nr:Fe-S cluster assembly protein IscX [Cupriavidus sp.]